MTITGTLNVRGMKTVHAKWESNTPLVGNATWRPLYAANVGVSFVVPPSGAVLVGFGGHIPADGHSTFLSYEIRTGANIGGGTWSCHISQCGATTYSRRLMALPPTAPARAAPSGTPRTTPTCSAVGRVCHPNQTYHIRPGLSEQEPSRSQVPVQVLLIVEPDL